MSSLKQLKEIIEQLNEKCDFDFKKNEPYSIYSIYICNKTGAKIYKNFDDYFFLESATNSTLEDLDSVSQPDNIVLCFNAIDFREYKVQTLNCSKYFSETYGRICTNYDLAFECPLKQLIQFFKTSI